jgi:hypothetical protein
MQAFDLNVDLVQKLSNDSGKRIINVDFVKYGQYTRVFMENNSNDYGRPNVCDLQLLFYGWCTLQGFLVLLASRLLWQLRGFPGPYPASCSITGLFTY